MTKSTEQRLDKILRRARRQVLDDDSKASTIARCKTILMATWDKRASESEHQKGQRLLRTYA